MSATLTTHHEGDVSHVPDLLKQIEIPIDAFYGDAGGYDQQYTWHLIVMNNVLIQNWF